MCVPHFEQVKSTSYICLGALLSYIILPILFPKFDFEILINRPIGNDTFSPVEANILRCPFYAYIIAHFEKFVKALHKMANVIHSVWTNNFFFPTAVGLSLLVICF